MFIAQERDSQLSMRADVCRLGFGEDMLLMLLLLCRYYTQKNKRFRARVTADLVDVVWR